MSERELMGDGGGAWDALRLLGDSGARHRRTGGGEGVNGGGGWLREIEAKMMMGFRG